MKSLYKFAGAIAILCALALSTVASTNKPEEPVNFIFSSCVSTFEFKSVSFDEKSNEMTITVTDVQAPAGVAGWDVLTLHWFADVVTDSISNRYYKGPNAGMSWQYGKMSSAKHANISARNMPVTKVVIVGNTYTYTCKLSTEQLAFLKSFAGIPGKCKDFSFSTLTGY